MRLKEVYTVEAAWVMSICMIVIGGALITSYHIYDNSLSYVRETGPKEYDAALRFREISVGKDIVGSLMGE